MKSDSQSLRTYTEVGTENSSELQKLISAIKADCTNCGVCQQDCGFLSKYGTPGEIAERFDASDPKTLARPFECSLCGLCASVCPQGLEVGGLFLELRREAVRRGAGSFPEHKVLLNYERLGTSRRFSWYGLPKDEYMEGTLSDIKRQIESLEAQDRKDSK